MLAAFALRHVFCADCLHAWLPLKPECPECRGPVEAASLAPDRLADNLVANVPSYCQMRSAGCTWMGKRGDLTSHLAHECQCVLVACSHEGCSTQVPRGKLGEHLASCTAQPEQHECPWGCGALMGRAQLERHKAECLMEPRKLMAAVQQLARENERLTLENLRLQAHSPAGLDDADAADDDELARPRRKRRGPGFCVD